MEGRQKNGLEEALETGASAAHLARGAVKAGKAVSGAAKGAAMGGPYGAAAGALWEGRKFVGKVLAAAAVLLLLPVLFVLMLPGLIFDGFSAAFSPADPETPVLNSETAIIEMTVRPPLWRMPTLSPSPSAASWGRHGRCHGTDRTGFCRIGRG